MFAASMSAAIKLANPTSLLQGDCSNETAFTLRQRLVLRETHQHNSMQDELARHAREMRIATRSAEASIGRMFVPMQHSLNRQNRSRYVEAKLDAMGEEITESLNCCL